MAMTEAEKRELAQLEREFGGKSSGLSAQEQNELSSLEKEFGAPSETKSPSAPEQMAQIRDNVPNIVNQTMGLLNGRFNDTGRTASSPGEYLDSIAGAPVRKGLDELAQGKGIVTAAKGGLSSVAADPKNAPTGYDVASHMGVENPYLGAALATAIDVGAQLPVLEGAQLLSKGASKASGVAGKYLNDLAEQRAFKSLGPVKSFEDSAQAKGLINQIGRQALDEGVVTPLASKKTMLDRAEHGADAKSAQLKGLLEDISQNKNLTPEQVADLDSAKFNPAQAGNALKAQIGDKYSDFSPRILESRTNQIDDFLHKDESFDILRAQNLKKNMNEFIKDRSYWQNNPSASQEGLMNIRRTIKEGIEKNADKYAEVVGQEGGRVRELNRSLGNNLEMGDILADRISRNSVNNNLSLGDKLAAIIGENALGWKGLLGAPVNMLMRSKGNQLLATGANRASKLLSESPSLQAIERVPSDDVAAAIESLARQIKHPEQLRAAEVDKKDRLKFAQ